MNRWRWLRLVAVWSVVLAGGCAMPFASGGGELSLTSQAASRVQLTGRFDKAYYRFDSPNVVTVVLVDGAISAPRRAATIRLFWQPFSGYTPVDPEATNATVQYIVFGAGGYGGGRGGRQVAVYSGAGFVYPDNAPGDATLRGGVWQASVRLTDRSRAYTDPLGASVLEGSFTAKRDAQKVQQVLHQIDTEVTARLGYPALVRRPVHGGVGTAALAQR